MRIVVKLGTSTLTAGTKRLSLPRLVDLARQIAGLRDSGHEVILVSSGAMATGRETLSFPRLPKEIPAKQMLASVGQPRLMGHYERIFGLYGIIVAQVLLTRDDLNRRRSYLNARNTLSALLAQQILPIVNENDTVATEEIRVGDNDNLSALVANLIDADTLVLLTDQPGLFSSDPRRDEGALLISEVTTPDIPAELWEAAGGTSSDLGTGGMTTKLQAADLARRSGTTVIVAGGGDQAILTRIAAGESVGTRFHPLESTMDSRKRYILASSASGSLTVDDGAVQALQNGGSLLPVGILSMEGSFERGDTVSVTDEASQQIARGIVNYRAEDVERILGRHSDDIEPLLGYHYGDAVIHHDDLILT
jgi:glutamate 5-kinase